MPSPHALDDATRDWLDSRWAWLAARLGPVPPDGPVLLTPEFFPDPFDGSAEAADLVGLRVAGHMRLPRGAAEFQVFEDPAQRIPDMATWEALGYYEDLGGGRCCVWYRSTLLGDPAVLVPILAHELAHHRLLGPGLIDRDEPDMEPVTDLATVYLGLGVPNANACVYEGTLRNADSGTWVAGRRGYLTLPVYGHALARYAAARGETDPDWRHHLRPDVRAAFDEGARDLAADTRTPAAEWNGPAPFDALTIGTEGPDEEAADAPDEGCVYCGADLPAGGDGVCHACERSIGDNQLDLAAQTRRRSGGDRLGRRAFWLAVVVFGVAAAWFAAGGSR